MASFATTILALAVLMIPGTMLAVAFGLLRLMGAL